MNTSNSSILARSVLAGVAVAGTLLMTNAQAQRHIGGPVIKGLEKVEHIDLRRSHLVSFKETGRSAISRDEAIDQAQRLVEMTGTGLALEPREQRDGVLTFVGSDDPSARLDIDLRDGAMSLSGSFEQYRNEKDTAGLPSPKSAPAIAFKQMQALGLLPSSKEMSLGPVGGLNMGVHHENGETAIFRKLVTVRVNRELAGYPVFGASRLLVHLGEQGRVQGLVRNWIDVEGRDVDPTLVLDPGSAVDAAGERIRKTSADAELVTIESAQVVLYDDGEGSIEPAIRVTALRRYKDKEIGEQPLDFYIPATSRTSALFPFMKDGEVPEPS